MRVWILRLRRYAPPLRMTPEASLHECAVDGLDGLLGIGFVNTGDDVDLRRTLVDDADVHLVLGESGKQFRGNTDLVRHAVTHGSDEGDTREHLDTVGAHLLRDVFENHVLHGVEGLAIHHDAHGVDGARAEFVGEAFAFEHGEHAATETDFLVHHGLFDVDHREALAAGDTRNRELRFFRGGADDGTGIFGAVRVADVDRQKIKKNNYSHKVINYQKLKYRSGKSFDFLYFEMKISTLVSCAPIIMDIFIDESCLVEGS